LKQPGDKAAVDEAIAEIEEGVGDGEGGRGGDKEETRGRGDAGTPREERRGDGETGRRGEKETKTPATLRQPVARLPLASSQQSLPAAPAGDEEIVPMSPIRKRIAERLVAAQHAAALTTTYNEIDMTAVMALRKEYQEPFQQRFGVKLGLMSFFVKATIEALKKAPALNAEIRGENIVYHNYYDIGIAVSGGKGLVVPVLRRAERLSFAEIERAIADLTERAKGNKIALDELAGGTFTISNGGVFGSLLSAPIVNPPQSGVLGMHAIQDRPVARDGQVVIRQMMYVALTYDHRLVDGREAVAFLRHIKDDIENPSRMLIEV
ncbi:MAG: dihydrolipoyllysine-residue succinyltransferase, partial [Phycisphaerae bacterium]|nr:dihydrolipoyllysine-residue succinyltransferase [Phycisphaerae bacterium]